MKSIITNKLFIYIPWITLLFFSCQEDKKPVKEPLVHVKYSKGYAELYRNGKPYHIKGASGNEHLDKVASYGGNSIRTWSLHNAKELLDEADKYGLTVTLGIEIGRPYWGEDFNYLNLIAVDKKINELKPYIEEFKDHPALLMWGVGNEVALRGGSRFLVYYVINRVAKMVKETDPNHPVMTAINAQTIGRVKHIMTHVDILGYNGFSLIENFYQDNKNYKEKGWGKAYIFTEWGVPGHWEVENTEWGAPLEMSTEEKLNYLEKNWNLINKDRIGFLGSYAFYWGNKYEITNTWFSHFSENGLESSSVKFLKSSWTEEKFENFMPVISNIRINDKETETNLYLHSNSVYTAQTLVDTEKDSLTFRWEIRPEESQFYEVDDYQHNMDYLILKDESTLIEFKAPKNEGPYRIFVFVSDKKGNFSSHNIPFYVVNR